jgi:hypothetical protein
VSDPAHHDLLILDEVVSGCIAKDGSLKSGNRELWRLKASSLIA